MKNPFKKWLLGLISLFAVLSIVGCGGGTWYGTGHVLEKDIRYGVQTWGDGERAPVIHDHCYHLGIMDDHGVKRDGCVSDRVWNDAMLGHQITLTKEYS